MVKVTLSVEPTAAFRRFIQHAVAAWIRGPIGNAVQYDVNINTGTQWFMEAFLTSAVNDFVYQKIGSLRVLTMKECCGNPNLIGDFDLGKNLGFQENS